MKLRGYRNREEEEARVKDGRRNLGKKLLLASVSTILTLVLLEFGARVYLWHVADKQAFSKYASLRQYQKQLASGEPAETEDGITWWYGLLAPHRYLGYIPAPNLVDEENKHNSLGFRGEEIVLPKPAGEFRIACLGASTTYTVLVPDYRGSYPAVLQTDLHDRGFAHTSVINGGGPAWSSYETLLSYLLRVQDLDPDLIIIHHAFGDVMTRLVWPPEAYAGDNSGYLVSRQTASRLPPVYEESTLLRMLLINSGRMLPHSSLDSSVYTEAETSCFMEYCRQFFAGTYPSGVFETVSVADMLKANPPVHFRRNIGDLVTIAKNTGVQPVLMTFIYSTEFKTFYFATEGFQAAIDEHNGILREIAQREDVPLIDLQAIFPKNVEYYEPDGIHVNAEGAQVKARLIADFLTKHHLVPK